MAIHVALNHRTSPTRYDRPVTLGPQVIRLRPAPHVPHRDPQLLAQADPRHRPLHQLAAGRLPATTWHASSIRRKVTGIPGRGGRRRRDVRVQPVRLLSRARTPRNIASPTKKLATKLAPFLRKKARATEVRGLRRLHRPHIRSARSIFWSTSTPAGQPPGELHVVIAWSPACRRRKTPHAGQRLVP